MRISFFAKINKHGLVGTTRTRPTSISAGEHVLEVNLNVDDEAFNPVPIPTIGGGCYHRGRRGALASLSVKIVRTDPQRHL